MRRTAAAAIFAEALHRYVPWFVGGSQDAENAMIDAIEQEARDQERARFADWLAGEISYPMDVRFETIPPVSIEEMAAAWHRLDPSQPIEEWQLWVEVDWTGPSDA
jgi:hypothetical protein